MATSFRNTSEIVELAGCDLRSISANLLEPLAGGSDPIDVN
jgi:hypothetical protein